MDSVRDILAATRIIGQKVPQAQPEVQEIMANVQRMMGKILGNQAPTEAQAPPL